MKRFSVHFTVQTTLQIVFLSNLKNVGSLSKMKPCTRRGPKIGKKTLESCDVQTFDSPVSECSCWCTYEGIEKQMANNSWTI